MKDFFISYTKTDKSWAEWIAWQLENEGYTTVIQAWNFLAGSNFVSEMQDAAVETDCTIAVISPAFFASPYTKYTDAEPLYRGALEIVETQLGADHPNSTTVCNNLENLLSDISSKGSYERLPIFEYLFCDMVNSPFSKKVDW